MQLIKSFSRRVSKSLTKTQQHLLVNDLPKYQFDATKLEHIIQANSNESQNIILEIGIGMGDNFINQIRHNPDNFYIGGETYLNGLARTLDLADKSGVHNFMLWPDDVDLLMDLMASNSLDEIWLLFPDPWPKRKQSKRRIFNPERLEIFQTKLKTGARLVFGSDIEEYFNSAVKILMDNPGFEIIYMGALCPLAHYQPTKFHLKALTENRTPRFLVAKYC